MPTIHVTSFIKAPLERVFDLSRSLSFRKKVFRQGAEQMLSSAGESLLKTGETITLRAKHLGKTREVTSRITETQQPLGLTEEQIRGDLKSFRHEYHFKPAENGTILIDIVEFEGPRDLLGALASRFFLKRYLQQMLEKKNELLRQYAESDKWQAVLS